MSDLEKLAETLDSIYDRIAGPGESYTAEDVASALLETDWLTIHDAQVQAETIRNLAEELSEPSILWLGRKSIPRDGLVEMLRIRAVPAEQKRSKTDE